MRARTVELNGAIAAVTDSLCTALYRNGAGTLGAIGSIGATTATTMAVTLSTSEDSVNFEPGMVIAASQYDTSSARTVGTTATVTSMDRNAGTLSLTFDNIGTNAYTWVANDVLYASGDRSGATFSKVSGLEAWVPRSAPGSTAFFGVDRTADTRLGGLRYDATSYAIDEGIMKAAIMAAREGAQVDHCFISYTKFADLVNILGSKVNYADLKVGGIGFNSLRLYTPAGEIKVIPDRKCPQNRAFLVDLKSWKFVSLGMTPQLLNYEGQDTIIQYNADGIELRVGYYGQLVCEAPGHNVNVLV
jgi:hypothetical protein